MVDSAPAAAEPVPGKNRRSLSTGRVVFLVIAAAAPLAAMVGNVPLALIDGNGVGLPVAFLIATLVLLCFSVGYAAMSRRVVNTGAFYTYIARALGKPAGIGSAYVAVVAYAGLTCGLVGAFGYFTRLVLLELGIDIPWYVYSAVAVAIIGALGYRSADLSAKVLGTLMIAEFSVLVVFDLLAVGEHGSNAFPAVSFTGAQVFSGSIGIALMFAFTSFVGFESAALYGEETKDPERSIPRATYIAVVTIGIFYILTTWIIIGAAGGTQAPELAGEQLGNFVFNLIQDAGGTVLYDLAAVLFCTSVLASALALHNAASRYLFALGRERVVPARLGRYHPRHQSPYVASLWVTGLAAVSTLVDGGVRCRSLHRLRHQLHRSRHAGHHRPAGRGGAGGGGLLLAPTGPQPLALHHRAADRLRRAGHRIRSGRHPLQHPHRVDQRAGRRGARAADRRGRRRRAGRAPAAATAAGRVLGYRGIATTPPAAHRRSGGTRRLPAAVLRRRCRTGRPVDGAGPGGGGRAVRLVRAAQRRRRHLGHGKPRQPDVRKRPLHQLEVHQRILRLSDAGVLSGLSELAADPRLHPEFRAAVRPVRPGHAVRRGDQRRATCRRPLAGDPVDR